MITQRIQAIVAKFIRITLISGASDITHLNLIISVNERSIMLLKYRSIDVITCNTYEDILMDIVQTN